MVLPCAPAGYATVLPGASAVGLGWLMSDMWTAPEDDPRSYGNPIGERQPTASASAITG
jgi:hypothetical protein